MGYITVKKLSVVYTILSISRVQGYNSYDVSTIRKMNAETRWIDKKILKTIHFMVCLYAKISSSCFFFFFLSTFYTVVFCVYM